MIVHVSVYLASWVLIRYRLPIDPLLILFVALALLDIWHRLVARWPQLDRALKVDGTIRRTGLSRHGRAA